MFRPKTIIGVIGKLSRLYRQIEKLEQKIPKINQRLKYYDYMVECLDNHKKEVVSLNELLKELVAIDQEELTKENLSYAHRRTVQSRVDAALPWLE